MRGKKFTQALAFIQPTGDVSEPEAPKSAATPGLSLVRLSRSEELLNEG